MLMSPYIFCKFSSFSKIISLNLFGLSGSQITEIVIREYILIASSGNEKHMPMRQKM